MTRMRRIYFAMILIMIVILATFDTSFYFTTKKTLLNKQLDTVEIVADNIRIAIEANGRGVALFENILAENLRMASVATQYALPPNHEDVTNEQLSSISKKLGVKAISLFKKERNGFVAVKSSEEKEIGLKTEGWGESWNRMLSQLMDKHDVQLEPDFGQAFPNFWSGPFETAYYDRNYVEKFGYYNDGTTDYLIDPFVNVSILAEYQKEAGVEKTIQDVVHSNPFLIEVGLLNYSVLQGTTKNLEEEIRTSSTDYQSRLLLYGEYNHPYEKDKELSKKAVEGGNNVYKVVTVDGREMLQSYVPISLKVDGNHSESKIIAIISSDYEYIQSELFEEEWSLFIKSLIFFAYGIALIFLLSRYVKRQAKIIDDVQNMYTSNIERLFKTVKEHRHDFNHHIFTLQGMSSMKLYTEMDNYLQNLTKVQTNINGIIGINIPAFIGLLQAKIAEGAEKNIHFEHHFEGFERMKLDIMKTTDVVRVLGNILDNAFHAVSESQNIENRKVSIMGKVTQSHLSISVYNNGEPIPEELKSRIFEHGFTTRENHGGTGLGLSSCKKIVEGYKGALLLQQYNGWTMFIVEIPLLPHELI